MDVILDSNAYLSDLRMESIRFKNLFDYLRRTKCSLVLPRLVREETISKYRYLLEVQAKKTAQAVENFNRLTIDKSSEVHFTAPMSVRAARELRTKFLNLEKAGFIRIYDDTTGVDVNEVFLRGVKRIRPASKEGEELRDVIIWLIALQYAEKEKKQIALVTNDDGFWDDTEVHKHLKWDIDQRKVNISLFRSIEDFIKNSAPKPTLVDQAYVSKIFEVGTLADQIITVTERGLSKRLLFQSSTLQSLKLVSSKFSAGTVYEIDAETKFAELTYDLSIAADVTFTEQENFLSPPGSLARGSILQPPWGKMPTLADMNRPLKDYLGIGVRTTFSWEPPRPGHTYVKSYSVSAKAYISIRLVKNSPAETELDRVEISDVEEAKDAEKASGTKSPSGGGG